VLADDKLGLLLSSSAHVSGDVAPGWALPPAENRLWRAFAASPSPLVTAEHVQCTSLLGDLAPGTHLASQVFPARCQNGGRFRASASIRICGRFRIRAQSGASVTQSASTVAPIRGGVDERTAGLASFRGSSQDAGFWTGRLCGFTRPESASEPRGVRRRSIMDDQGGAVVAVPTEGTSGQRRAALFQACGAAARPLHSASGWLCRSTAAGPVASWVMRHEMHGDDVALGRPPLFEEAWATLIAFVSRAPAFAHGLRTRRLKRWRQAALGRPTLVVVVPRAPPALVAHRDRLGGKR